MAELTAENAAQLLERFSGFGDAVVRRFELAGVDRRVVVELDAQDSEADGNWVRVSFRSESLKEWRLIQINTTAGIVVYEAAILVGPQLVLLSLDRPSSEPPTADDLRGSDFYVGANSFTWEVTALPA
jgi:hypothetical protein